MAKHTLITGASGMLGTDLKTLFCQKYGNEYVHAFSKEELNICEAEKVEATLLKLRPAIIINAAAYTNVDGAESEREKAHEINVVGPRIIAMLANQIGAHLIHFSTDQVFDGNKDLPWTEEDIPNPLNYYATTKLLGEKEVLKYSRSTVLRVQWLFGEKKDRFTLIKDKKVFTPFSDQWGAPTWTKHIAEVVLQLIEKNASGLYHYSYDDYASWAEIYSFVKEEMNYDTELIPQKTADVDLPAKRPRYAVLSNKKLAHTLGVESLGSWKDALKEFLHG